MTWQAKGRRWVFVAGVNDFDQPEDLYSIPKTRCAWKLDHSVAPLCENPYNVLRYYRNGFWANFNKTEKNRYSFANAKFYRYPSTTLRECDVCSKLSTPKKIMCRNLLYKWNVDDKKDYETPSKNMLCTGCWNKIRVLVKRQNVCEENKRLTAKLKTEINKWVKLQQQVS
jgi:hypothetical protein